MAHFVLNTNADGTVSLAKKTRVMAEVCGKVSSINRQNNTIFTIHAEKMNRDFRCILTYNKPFCPIKIGDALFGIAEYLSLIHI